LKYNRNGFSTGVTDPNTRLKLHQFYFAFLVLFFGFLISFVQFLREKMHYCFEKQQIKEHEMLNARAAPKVKAAVNKQRNNTVEINKVIGDHREERRGK
jgi:hypothetical protein